jgi:hypothetical protein
MRILERKSYVELVAHATCNSCKSVIEIEKSECTERHDEGRRFYQTDEKCPVCGKNYLFLFVSDFKHNKS